MRQAVKNCQKIKINSLFFRAGILLFVVGLSFPGKALAILAFPGSTWDQISHDVDSLVGTGAQKGGL